MKVRYFCANCGAEVGLHEATCPTCKRGFLSVKCPRCGFKGEADLFASGCPSCGYMTESRDEPTAARSRRPRKSRWAGKPDAEERHPAGLSARFYRLAGIVLGAVIVALVVLLLLL